MLWGGVAAMVLALVAGDAYAQAQPTYKCVGRTSAGRTSVTYTHVPCTGGTELGAHRRVTDKSVPPPQDRATLARRASLSPEDKQECRALDARIGEQKMQLKARGDTITLQDEMPLVHNQRRYRDLRC
jgi:hypothetical protein